MQTIRLPSDTYRLNTDGAVDVLRPVRASDDWEWHASKYQVGRQAVLVGTTDVSPNAMRAGTHENFHLSFDLDGVGGNSNPSIKRTSGWRGTTNDKSVDAHGVVTIRKIRALKSGDISVTVS